MDPTILMQIPGLLQSIVGMFHKQRDPREEMQRNLQMLQEMFSPQKIGGQANEMYKVLAGSPMFTQMINNIISGGQQSQNLLTRNLAGAGIQGSGVGQIQRSLAPSVMAGQVGQAKAGLYGQGLNSVMSLIGPMIEGGWRMGGRPEDNRLMNLAGGIQNTNWGPLLNMLRRSQGGRPAAYPGQNITPKLLPDYGNF